MSDAPDRRRPLWVDLTILGLCAVVFVTLIALGNWQVRRLAWKVDLIEAVETRAFGQPVAPPEGPVTADEHAYLRVMVAGVFDHAASADVKAVTELGPGFWRMTPLRGDDGRTIWINRGFVPAEREQPVITALDAPVTLTGLVRISEPGGTALERNRPDSGRWVSRDVAALSDWAQIDAAPFFIDADHQGAADAWPRGGLTKLAFRNSHLSYAITWYAMAALLLAGVSYAIYDRRRGSRPRLNDPKIVDIASRRRH